jgi:hypothetical protein
MVKPLTLEGSQRFPQGLNLSAQGMRGQVAVVPCCVALGAQRLRHVEHDRACQRVVFAREREEALAVLGEHARGGLMGGRDRQQHVGPSSTVTGS